MRFQPSSRKGISSILKNMGPSKEISTRAHCGWALSAWRAWITISTCDSTNIAKGRNTYQQCSIDDHARFGARQLISMRIRWPTCSSPVKPSSAEPGPVKRVFATYECVSITDSYTHNRRTDLLEELSLEESGHVIAIAHLGKIKQKRRIVVRCDLAGAIPNICAKSERRSVKRMNCMLHGAYCSGSWSYSLSWSNGHKRRPVMMLYQPRSTLRMSCGIPPGRKA